MAYVESSVVVYLRAVYGITDLLKDSFLITDKFTFIELGREAATLAIMIMIGWIAGRNFQERIGYGLFAFGTWDIFYYVWLYVFIGWPTSLFEWDILFLIPLPWWGPVITPILISLLMILYGITSVFKSERSQFIRMKFGNMVILASGILLILFSFMYDAISALPQGMEAVAAVKPSSYKWYLYFGGMMFLIYFTLKSLKNFNMK